MNRRLHVVSGPEPHNSAHGTPATRTSAIPGRVLLAALRTVVVRSGPESVAHWQEIRAGQSDEELIARMLANPVPLPVEVLAEAAALMEAGR